MAVIQQTFFEPMVSSGVTKKDMQLMGLDFQYDINAGLYGRGQMAYAYSGDQTGGYTTGLLGWVYAHLDGMVYRRLLLFH